ncbi:MAG: HAD-IIIA family hydrolase [Candidatus Pacearchaeota archaeon]|nr:HAD-IIIA family hydrolase [Candidatus Pacearchaeota archaeon]
MKKALFLDRDGIVNNLIKKYSESYNKIIDDSPFSLSELNFIDGIKELVSTARYMKYKVIIVTNQPSYLKENRPLKDYEAITTKICEYLSLERGDVFECFHKEGFSLPCECRKPKPGLFYMAKGLHNLNLEKSIMVGDSFSDIKAAKAAKIGLTIYLRRKESEQQIGNFEDEKEMSEKGPVADYIVDDLYQVEKKIKEI